MATDFFKKLATEFSTKQLDLAAQRFEYPSALYLGDKTIVYHSQAELGAALNVYRAHLNLYDYSWTQAEIVGMTSKRGNQQIIWVDWCHLDQSGETIERTVVKHFCRDAEEDDLKIQLAEFVEPNEQYDPGTLQPTHARTMLLQ